MPDAAVILAGGGGRRLGGVDKPELLVSGVRLLDRALAAVSDVAAHCIVVVGPHRDQPSRNPARHRETRRAPGRPPPWPRAWPSWGRYRTTGRWRCWPRTCRPSPPTPLHRLEAALADGTGAVLADAAGRRQYLIGVFRAGPLIAAAAGQDWVGQRLGRMLDPLVTAEVPAAGIRGR